jgi:hypothetical protein
MSQPPPSKHYEALLVRMRTPGQKGGTIIFESVTSYEQHELRIDDPDAYRPGFCPNPDCLKRHLVVHDYRYRTLRAELNRPEIRIVRHECVDCGAIWRILPLFLARHLWRTWTVVRRALSPDRASTAEKHWPKVPARTVRRWKQRWLRPARALAQVLTTSGPRWAALAIRQPGAVTCASLVAEFAAGYVGEPMAGFAALIFRLQPRFRLM